MCLAHDAAPAGVGGRGAETEIGEGRLGENGDRDLRRGVEQQGSERVRKNVSVEDTPFVCAERACGGDERGEVEALGDRAGYFPKDRNVEKGDRAQHGEPSRFVERGDEEGGQQGGKGEEQIGSLFLDAAHARDLPLALALALLFATATLLATTLAELLATLFDARRTEVETS